MVPLAARVPDLGSWLTTSTAAAASTRRAKVRAAASLISRPVNAEVLLAESAEESFISELESRAGGHLVPDGTVEVDEVNMGGGRVAPEKLVKFVEVFAEFLLAMVERPTYGPFVSPVAVDPVGTRGDGLGGRLSLEANGIVSDVSDLSFLFVDCVEMSSVEFIEVDVAVFEDRCPKCLGEDGRANRGDNCVLCFLQFASKPPPEFDCLGQLRVDDFLFP